MTNCVECVNKCIKIKNLKKNVNLNMSGTAEVTDILKAVVCIEGIMSVQ
jgi:hypothetical protein